MRPRILTERSGYRIALDERIALAFLIDPEGRPLAWTGVGDGSFASCMAVKGAFEAREMVERMRRAA